MKKSLYFLHFPPHSYKTGSSPWNVINLWWNFVKIAKATQYFASGRQWSSVRTFRIYCLTLFQFVITNLHTTLLSNSEFLKIGIRKAALLLWPLSFTHTHTHTHITRILELYNTESKKRQNMTSRRTSCAMLLQLGPVLSVWRSAVFPWRQCQAQRRNESGCQAQRRNESGYQAQRRNESGYQAQRRKKIRVPRLQDVTECQAQWRNESGCQAQRRDSVKLKDVMSRGA
jgi:hypothetical protein